MTSRLVTKEPKSGTYETFTELEGTLDALEEGETVCGWCWLCTFEPCCWCGKETGSDAGNDEVQCALVSYVQDVASTPQGRNSKKIAVSQQDFVDSSEQQETYLLEKRKHLLIHRKFSDTSISRSDPTTTARSFDADNEISLPPKEIIKYFEEKQADSNAVEEMRNEQEQVKFDYEYLSQQDKFQDYIAMISTSNLPMFVDEANRERFFQPETGVNISNNTMETEQEYQSEDTLPNSNEEVQETYYARDDEGMECHSNTDVMLDQILETLVSNGLELEFLLTKHIKQKQEATPEFRRESYNASDLSHDASNVTTTVKETNLTLLHLTCDTVSDAVQCTNNAEEQEVTSSNRNELTEKQIKFQDPYNISDDSEKKTCIIVDIFEKPKYEPSSDDKKILVASSKEKNENSEEKRSCLNTSETMEQKTSLHKSKVHDSSNNSDNLKISELQPTGKVQEQSRSSKKMEIGVKFVNYISNGLKQSKICTSKRERESVEKLPLTHQVPSCPEQLDLQTTSDGEELQKTGLPGNGEDSKVESVDKLPLTHEAPSCPEQLDLQTTSDGEELQKTDLTGNGKDSKVESVEKLPLTHQVPSCPEQLDLQTTSGGEDLQKRDLPGNGEDSKVELVDKLPLTHEASSCPEQLDLQTISDGEELQKADLPGNGKNFKVTMSQCMADGLEKSESYILNHIEEIQITIQNANEEKTKDGQVKLEVTNHTANDVEEIIYQGKKQEVYKSQVDLQLNTDISCATELIQRPEETSPSATQADLENPVDNSTPKKLEEVNKDELESSIQEEFVNCKNKSTTSKNSVKRLVTCLVPRIKCKSSNSEEEDQLLELKETAQTDNMVTILITENSQDSQCQSAIDKQEKYNLPNLNEFHEILDTMSTACTSPQSIQGGKKEPIREVREASQTVGDIDGRYEQQIEDIPQKERKPLIIISSTISKSVPEITKTSEDGNNKLPLRLKDEAGVSEAHSSPMLASPRNGTKSATTSPVRSGSKRVGHDWHHEEDLDRIVGLHGRASLSTLGARSDSMASVYSGAGEGRYGSVAVRGQVEFGLQYNYKAGALEIQIKQCRDLAPVDIKRNRSDPYVKVYLLPDKSKSGKRKTKVKKHTLNPVFDECLKFHISLNGLETRTLWLTVWHSDMFGRNDFLGEVMMTLENKVFDDPTPKWYNLQERTEPFEDVSSYKGDIIVCLKFVPPDMTIQKKGKRSRGALHVLIKEAKALTAVKANGTSDPFCKSYLLPDKGRSSKQKTPIARRTTNPVWNYTFVYDDVSLQELAERCLELTVWDHDRLASNEFLGGVRFSLGTGKHYGKPVDWMDASGREMSLWKNMLEKPNFWVEGSLSLRSSLESRGS